MLRKIINYGNVAFIRAFIPINILVTIISLSSAEKIEFFSIFIATGQILATIDFGVCARLISTPKVGSHSRVISLYLSYFKSLGYLKLFICALLVVVSVCFEFFYFAVLIGFSCIVSEVLILYNLCANSSISERKYGDFYSLIIIMLVIQFSGFVFSYHSAVQAYYIEVLIFITALSISVLFVFTKFSYGVDLVKCDDIKSKISIRLQVSQVVSSLVFNKEYILLSVFSLSDKAVTFAIVSRIMMIPLQVNSVIISKMWSDIANSIGVRKGLFRKQIYWLMYATSFTCMLSILYLLLTINEDIAFLLVSLCLFVIANSFSGLSSAYATVDLDAIPTVAWYLKSMSILTVVSLVCYFFCYPEFSVMASSLFFVLLGERNLRYVRWS